MEHSQRAGVALRIVARTPSAVPHGMEGCASDQTETARAVALVLPVLRWPQMGVRERGREPVQYQGDKPAHSPAYQRAVRKCAGSRATVQRQGVRQSLETPAGEGNAATAPLVWPSVRRRRTAGTGEAVQRRRTPALHAKDWRECLCPSTA